MALAATRRDAERGTRRDHRRLERADERPDHEAAIRERQDRIRHELARAVVGHLATALDPDDLDPPPGERRRVGEDVAGSDVPAERQDRRMLEEEQLIGDPTLARSSTSRCCSARASRYAIRPSHEATIGPGSGVDPVRPWASVSIATRAR
jgi:hypothetical protein